MISKKYKCMYIHINKTGGTSIEKVFEEDGGRKCLYRNNNVQCHISSREYKKKLPENIWDSLFKFSFVRNPWDRFVSLFHYRKVQYDFNDVLNLMSEFYDYKQKKINGNKSFIPFHKNIKNTKLRLINHFCSNQLGWISDNDGNLLVDYVGKFENIDADFKEVCDRINKPFYLPHVNKSKHKHFTEYYSSQTRDIISKIFAKDIEKFNYTFDK